MTNIRYNFKATAVIGGWYGWGYGDTPEQAAQRLADQVPSAERKKVLRDVTLTSRVDNDSGETWSYTGSIPADVVVASFEKTKLRIGKLC